MQVNSIIVNQLLKTLTGNYEGNSDSSTPPWNFFGPFLSPVRKQTVADSFRAPSADRGGVVCFTGSTEHRPVGEVHSREQIVPSVGNTSGETPSASEKIYP